MARAALAVPAVGMDTCPGKAGTCGAGTREYSNVTRRMTQYLKVTWSRSAAARALRATIIAPGLFALCFEVIGNPQMTAFNGGLTLTQEFELGGHRGSRTTAVDAELTSARYRREVVGRNLKIEALFLVLRREIPWRQHSHRAYYIANAMRISDEFC